MIGLFSFLNCNETNASKSGSEAGDLNEDFFAFLFRCVVHGGYDPTHYRRAHHPGQDSDDAYGV